MLGKDFLDMYVALLERSHILSETTKPTNALADNDSITGYFRKNDLL